MNELRRTLNFYLGVEDLSTMNVDSINQALQIKFGSETEVKFLRGLVGDIVEAYITTMEFLKGSAGSVFEKKNLPARIVKFAESLSEENKLYFPESMSVQTYQSAFSFMESLGLIKTEEKSMIRVLPGTKDGDDAEERLRELLKAVI